VMNIQREAIYSKRNNALSGERLSIDLHNMFTSLVENIVIDFRAVENYDGFRNECLRILGVDPDIDKASFDEGNEDDLIAKLQSQTKEFYERKGDKIKEILLPVIKRVHEHEGHKYKRIAIPFTDGSATPLPIAAELEEAINSNGESIMKDIEKAVTLAIIDDSWKEHLRAMDELKESVQAASFEQKDPLVIYKMEAYDLFERLIYKINEEVSAYLMKGRLVLQEQENLKEAREQKTDLSKTQTSRSEMAARAAAAGVSRQSKKWDETHHALVGAERSTNNAMVKINLN